MIALSIDVSKAFDSVNHAILKGKLERMGVRGKAGDLISSYLHDRNQIIRVKDNQLTKKMKITTGIPQGSALGPSLYIAYTNDLPKEMNNEGILQYADDSNIYKTGKTVEGVLDLLQKKTDVAIEWYDVNGLKINAKKSSLMCFISEKNVENKKIMGKA